MNLREAYLKTAALFEEHPRTYDFQHCGIPDTDDPHRCDSIGCVLGWVGYFAYGRRTDLYHYWQVSARLGLEPELYRNFEKYPTSAVCPSETSATHTFYNRLNDLAGTNRWMRNAKEAARVLRLYVAQYHPAIERKAA